MSATQALAEPGRVVESKCRIEEVLDQNVIELLRLAPRNPPVRALLLKLTGKMPGPKCETFEQIKEWVETSCEKRTVQNGPAGTQSTEGISITIEFTQTEYGRADYSVRRYGTEQFQISAEDLIEIVRESIQNGGSIDQALEMIAAKIEEDAYTECDPAMDEYGDYDYDDHDANDTGDTQTEYSRSDLRTAVLAFIRERHPELAREL